MLPAAAKLAAAAMTGLGTLTTALGLTEAPGARGILVATGVTFALAGLLFLDQREPAGPAMAQ